MVFEALVTAANFSFDISYVVTAVVPPGLHRNQALSSDDTGASDLGIVMKHSVRMRVTVRGGTLYDTFPLRNSLRSATTNLVGVVAALCPEPARNQFSL